MDGKRSRRMKLEDDLIANDDEILDFLAAFGRQPAKPAAAKKPQAPKAKAAASRKPQVRCLRERIWLAEVHAAEMEDRRRERAGLPPRVSEKTWADIGGG